MQKTMTTVADFYEFIESNRLVVIHVMRDHCSVCHAVLPQIAGLVDEYPQIPLGVINQSDVEAIAGELSIFTVPVDLIFMDGKEMHRQARFIDMQQFEHQLGLMYQSLLD
ncbi:thioredoxin family protein [Staphylococcus caeli]|uniref:thioredoxin family protein n=1 Tax=Staphylococcus caeli TaxID=2201815 RepID=UPI003F544C8C